jgi:Ran GTPase-activating protein (RanGAP) involved in mRNA processing and transport
MFRFNSCLSRINRGGTDVALSNSSLSVSDCLQLAATLSVAPNLTCLWLSDNQIGDEGVCILASAILLSVTLTRLDLVDNQIGDKGAVALASAALTELSLVHNQIGDEGAAALAAAIMSPSSKLKHLHLGYNQIGEKGAAALMEALPLSSLTYLSMGGCNISAATLKCIDVRLELINSDRYGVFLTLVAFEELPSDLLRTLSQI